MRYMDSKPFIIRLNDAEREVLERMRVSSGARSWAEVIRALIAGEAQGRAETVVGKFRVDDPVRDYETIREVLPAVQLVVTPKATTPKKAGDPPTFKSRLKGAWKAP